MQNMVCHTPGPAAPRQLTPQVRADQRVSPNGLVKRIRRGWIGWAALVAGVGAAVAAITLTATPAEEGLTRGFAALLAFIALLSLVVRNQTTTLWGLFVAGFALLLLPWLAGFAADPGSAWTAWVVGFLAMALGAVGWLNRRTPTV